MVVLLWFCKISSGVSQSLNYLFWTLYSLTNYQYIRSLKHKIAMTKGLIGGMTDYNHQSFEDILKDLKAQ